ncbi:hypothetical protein NJB1604_02210 [Mycobacterium marinum]|nr:hypothetical protein NJB1604_02210 [Mycobacterium marinum]
MQATEAVFGERVRDARSKRQWTQRQLAERLNLDSSAVSRLEQGTRAVRLGEAALIARALNVDLDFLVYGELDPVAMLRRSRAEANEYMHDMRSAAMEMATAYVNITELLDEDPDLFAHLEQDSNAPTDDLPTSVDEYLEWARRRIETVFRVPHSSDRLVVDDEHRALQLMALVEAVVKQIVSTVPFPESRLGRGLARLIPTEVEAPEDEPQS